LGVRGLRDGRNYASDGKSHLIGLSASTNIEIGLGHRMWKLTAPGKVRLYQPRLTAFLDELAQTMLFRKLRVDQKPYWDVERARVGNSARCP
jgi:hypothetical protein